MPDDPADPLPDPDDPDVDPIPTMTGLSQHHDRTPTRERPVWTDHDYDEPDDPAPVDQPNVPTTGNNV